ncbi:protein of unknown function (DUF4189) [Hoeflea sp. IMCC20628]|nr:protein of unknown function (DUF4189) [Hoeflea sp. IMCC20628]
MVQIAFIFFKRITTVAVLAFMTTGVAAAADNFGAIAFSKATGGYGFVYDRQSRREAENGAMRECRSRTSGCQVAVWFRNGCGAVAIGSNGWGSEPGATRQAAERAARRKCSRYTNGCQVLAWSCTSR